MKMKGYSGYRGRRKKQKVLVTLVLVAVVLLCGGFLLLQDYFVYDDSGKIHLELPFFGEKEDDAASLDKDEVNLDILTPEEQPSSYRK